MLHLSHYSGTPYWSQGAEKQYYVTKTCSTRTFCEERMANFTQNCHRIWYEDWKCAECCQGDRCNYYAFVSSTWISHFNHLHACPKFFRWEQAQPLLALQLSPRLSPLQSETGFETWHFWEQTAGTPVIFRYILFIHSMLSHDLPPSKQHIHAWC